MTAVTSLQTSDSAVGVSHGDAGAAEKTKDARVDIRVDELIVGRPLKFPIYDPRGTLLLAEGKTISSDFKRLLKQRGINSVRVNAADSARLKLSKPTEEAAAGLVLDMEIAAALDRVIDSGLLTVQNRGKAVKADLTVHGRTGYNQAKKEELSQRKSAKAEHLGNLMKDALRGKSVSTSTISTAAVESLADMADDSDCMLAVAMEAHAREGLAEHSLKMSTLAMAIGIEMGLDEDNCKRLYVAGMVHDWGLAKLPEEIVSPARPYTASEYFEFKKHPILSAEILQRMIDIPSMVAVVSYQVHERPNGNGYPRGRTGDRIHQFARILSTADAYSHLTSARPWRPALAPYAAMEGLIRLARTKDLDPEVVRNFLKLMTLFPIGSYVTLDDGSVARVLRKNGENYTLPIVQIVEDANGDPVPADRPESIVDLANAAVKIVQALPTPGSDEILLTDEILDEIRNQL